MLAAFAVLSFGLAPLEAGSITYVTPPGSTQSGLPVDAKAEITTGAGVVFITLSNLQADPKASPRI
jgi:hypothetical protein